MPYKTTITITSLLGILLAPVLAFSQTPPTNWSELDIQAKAMAPVASILAAEIIDQQCMPVHELNALDSTPIGSSFKLYILAEIADQIRQKKFIRKQSYSPYRRLTWSRLFDIRPEYKSIPGGPLLFVEDGSRYTLRYLAEQMIQRSDNTATDHLLFLAGRRKVESRLEKTQHHNPSLNIPLLSTREFAVMKFLWPDEQLQAYEAARVGKRRRLLNEEQRGWTELEAFFTETGEQTQPVRADRVEWFANRYDMCELMSSIHTLGQEQRMRPLLEVLTLADPINFDREDWSYVGFKGGSEMGVQAGNWLLQRNDGRTFFLSIAFLDTDQALNLGELVPLLFSIPDLLYATP
ncbi:MAG: class A beta-lactamase-related serine hydrolase [Xanthomonadales bacterium]|nr:class A beta-lactamase-related serine hydrolase [Xanthomonadales bacterium]